MAKHHTLAEQRGLTLEPQLEAALPPVTTDAELMKEVLTRLLDNALNYTPRVFDRFFRGMATRHYTIPGVGLGLPICQVIVDKLGGRITVESEVGHGTAFTVWLR